MNLVGSCLHKDVVKRLITPNGVKISNTTEASDLFDSEECERKVDEKEYEFYREESEEKAAEKDYEDKDENFLFDIDNDEEAAIEKTEENKKK